MTNRFSHLTKDQIKRRADFLLSQMPTATNKEEIEKEFFEVMEAYWDKTLVK